MKQILLALAFVVAASSSVFAQAPTAWTLRVYLAGAGTPISTTTFALAQVTCNTTAPTGGTSNPTKASWDDPVNAGKACVYTDPGTGPLSSTPIGGNYEATLTATNANGTSAESARAAFTHPGVPPTAPTGLKIVG